MNYKKDDIKPIWLDSNYNTKLLGLAKLITFNGKGLPFILEDMPEHKQITYNTEKWLVEFVESDKYPKGFKKNCTLRIVDTERILLEEYEKEVTVFDNFLTVNGKEIY
tara:strand:+ start:186 stop:509 length:324 start_codon:yes stop_codon:yes gene_type:complete